MEFTKEDFQNFKDQYEKTRENNLKFFTFKNKEFDIWYAKYIIEYLEPKFK